MSVDDKPCSWCGALPGDPCHTSGGDPMPNRYDQRTYHPQRGGQSMIDTTEAVRLAAEARCEWAGCDDPPCPMHLGQQRTAVAAALPALAEQFAALVEATESPQDGWLYRDSVVRRIREAAEVTG